MAKKPEILLIAATNIGRDLGPRCAARLHTGLTADCTHLDVDVEKYAAFLQEASTLPQAQIDALNREDRNLKMTPSGIRRSPNGYHYLPALPSADGYRSSGRTEEGRVQRG